MSIINYESNFPYEIELAIKGLNNKKRRLVISYLFSEGKKSFTDILRSTKINRSLLANHLNILIETLLIDRFYEHTSENEKYSYYQITDLGENVISGLKDSLYQKTKIIISRTITETFEIETSASLSDLLHALINRTSEERKTSTSSENIRAKFVVKR